MGNKVARCVPQRRRKGEKLGLRDDSYTKSNSKDNSRIINTNGTIKREPPNETAENETTEKKNTETENAKNRDTNMSGLEPIRPQKLLYAALYDFNGRTEEDLSFKKGEQLEVIENNDGKWWFAKSSATGRSGYVPSNYIEPFNSLKLHDWYFGKLRRIHAERMLLRVGTTGTFLIRDSESKPGDYSLSLRDGESIKHYRVRKLDNGGFYISTRVRFIGLPELIEHYTRDSDGLSSKLKNACPSESPTLGTLSYKDPWEVPRDRIKLLRLLGRGQFGEVWEGRWNETIEVAVKMLKTGSMKKEDFLKEAMVMKKLSHPKLVQLYAICSESEPIYIITELMSLGSLQKLLQSPEGKKIKLPDLIDVSAQVASGMAYLEKNNFIHRDLAARNVLVKENNLVKIGDFGLSRFVSPDQNVSDEDDPDVKFPIKWTAPEAALTKRFTTKSDVWSFGILLYEIITYGRVPYPGMTHHEVLMSVKDGYRMEQPDGCPDDLYNHMRRCWREKPEERPTFESLQYDLEDYFIIENGNYMEAGTL